jgi:methylmalonyl-CoA mutase cobalamin-binding subunit
MMAAQRRVALVAPGDESRSRLATYLASVGFDVHACAELELPSAFAAVVVISAREATGDVLVAEIRSWLRSAKSQRIVVVTAKPTALKDLVATHGDRLRVLAAPAFGWDVVDALRAPEPTRPRGA